MDETRSSSGGIERFYFPTFAALYRSLIRPGAVRTRLFALADALYGKIGFR
jgi:hypothetical protein